MTKKLPKKTNTEINEFENHEFRDTNDLIVEFLDESKNKYKGDYTTFFEFTNLNPVIKILNNYSISPENKRIIRFEIIDYSFSECNSRNNRTYLILDEKECSIKGYSNETYDVFNDSEPLTVVLNDDIVEIFDSIIKDDSIHFFFDYINCIDFWKFYMFHFESFFTDNPKEAITKIIVTYKDNEQKVIYLKSLPVEEHFMSLMNMIVEMNEKVVKKRTIKPITIIKEIKTIS